MEKEFIYAKHLWDLVDDEVFLIEYYPDFKSEWIAKEGGVQWRNTKDIVKFNSWTYEMFITINPLFIGPDGSELPDGNSEIIAIRLHTLATLATNFKEIYNLIQETEGNSINDFGLDSLIEKTHIALTGQYLDEFLKNAERLKKVESFQPIVNNIKKKIKELNNTDNRENYLDGIYVFQEMLSDFIDDIDSQELDIIPGVEMHNANNILKYITLVEASLYYMILIYETIEYKELLKIGIDDEMNKLFVYEREERIRFVEAMNSNEIKN